MILVQCGQVTDIPSVQICITAVFVKLCTTGSTCSPVRVQTIDIPFNWFEVFSSLDLLCQSLLTACLIARDSGPGGGGG